MLWSTTRVLCIFLFFIFALVTAAMLLLRLLLSLFRFFLLCLFFLLPFALGTTASLLLRILLSHFLILRLAIFSNIILWWGWGMVRCSRL